MRHTKSYTIESELSAFIEETKGAASASERVNELLRRAMLQERLDQLESEARQFFSAAPSDRTEVRAMQKAALRTFARD